MNSLVKTSLLTELTAMFPYEFEAWRESGEDERHALSSAVMRFLNTPKNWRVNAEYRCEFGGLFPIHLRYTSPDEQFYLCVCSPGDISAEWLVVMVSADGTFVRELLRSGTFCPERINTLLATTEQICRLKYTVRGTAAFLLEEVTL